MKDKIYEISDKGKESSISIIKDGENIIKIHESRSDDYLCVGDKVKIEIYGEKEGVKQAVVSEIVEKVDRNNIKRYDSRPILEKLKGYKTILVDADYFMEELSIVAEGRINNNMEFPLVKQYLLEADYIKCLNPIYLYKEMPEKHKLNSILLELFDQVELLIQKKKIDINLDKNWFDFNQANIYQYEWQAWYSDNIANIFNKIELLLNQKGYGFIWFKTFENQIYYGIFNFNDYKNKKCLNIFEGRNKFVDLKLKIVYDSKTYLVNYKTNNLFEIPGTDIKFIIVIKETCEHFVKKEELVMYINCSATGAMDGMEKYSKYRGISRGMFIGLPNYRLWDNYVLEKNNMQSKYVTNIEDGFNLKLNNNKILEVTII